MSVRVDPRELRELGWRSVRADAWRYPKRARKYALQMNLHSQKIETIILYVDERECYPEVFTRHGGYNDRGVFDQLGRHDAEEVDAAIQELHQRYNITV